MPPLSATQVRHIAKLARLKLSDEEVEKFTTELGSILAYVEMLQEVDTKNVEPTAQVTGSTNVFRADEIGTAQCTPESLVAVSPLPITDRQIETPSAHGPTTQELESF